MKRIGTMAVCLAGGLVLLHAEDVVLPSNPYAIVVTRNIFGLNPPPVVDPNATVVEPPVKIIPNGIMSIFGNLQVLFKVAAKPGGKDASYVLMEGQQQDDIEVVKINEKAAIVTFNNHGIMQELPLVVTAPTSTPSVPTGGNPRAPGIVPGAAPAAGNTGNNPFNNRFGNRGSNGGGNGGNNPAADNGSGTRNVPTRAGYHVDGPIVEPAVQHIVIEALREEYKRTGDTAAKILPPTALTPPEDSESGNAQ